MIEPGTDIKTVISMIKDPSNYRKTQPKKTELWCCAPKVGTQFFDEVEQDYITAAIYTRDCRVDTHAQPFVLYNDAHAYEVLKLGDLCRFYTLVDGTPITRELLLSKRDDNGLIDWFKIVPDIKPNTRLFSLWIPKDIAFTYQISSTMSFTVNNPSRNDHLKGDFIVCNSTPDGQADIKTMRCVSGIEYSLFFDYRSWLKFSQHISRTKAPISIYKLKTTV